MFAKFSKYFRHIIVTNIEIYKKNTFVLSVGMTSGGVGPAADVGPEMRGMYLTACVTGAPPHRISGEIINLPNQHFPASRSSKQEA